MKFVWIVPAAAVAAMSLIAADPALARAKHHARHYTQRQCVDRPVPFTFDFLIPGSPTPQPNGCSPPVYEFGRFVGQDPDANIRFQLHRDPQSGYAPL